MTSTSPELRYRNKPRHPDAPCDEDGRKIEVLRCVRGIALLRYVDSPERSLFGEYDQGEGVARRVQEVDLAELMDLLDSMEEDSNE